MHSISNRKSVVTLIPVCSLSDAPVGQTLLYMHRCTLAHAWVRVRMYVLASKCLRKCTICILAPMYPKQKHISTSYGITIKRSDSLVGQYLMPLL